jgi:hypothetical protein
MCCGVYLFQCARWSITDAYASVRRQTAAETGLSLETFPAACPWTAEQVLDDDFWPQGTK